MYSQEPSLLQDQSSMSSDARTIVNQLLSPASFEAYKSNRISPEFKRAFMAAVTADDVNFSNIVDQMVKESERHPTLAPLFFKLNVQMTRRREKLEHSKNQEQQDLAYRDDLTNLPNRRALKEMFPEIQDRVKKGEISADLLYIDLDRFKQINDTFGHNKGDIVLTHAAERLDATIRKNHDHVFRVGGDEFIVILVNTSPDSTNLESREINVAKQIEHLQRTLDQPISFYPNKTSQTKITADVGYSIGSTPIDETSLNELLETSDIKMQEDKEKRHSLNLTTNRWNPSYPPQHVSITLN